MSSKTFPHWKFTNRYPVSPSFILSAVMLIFGIPTRLETEDESVVFLVTDNTINPILNPSEVAHLFSMPLPAFLHHRPSQIPGWQFRSHRIDTGPGKVGPPPQVPYANQPRPQSRLPKETGPSESTNRQDKGASAGSGEEDDEEESESIGGGEGRYYQYRDVNWGEPGQKVRMHRFLTGREGGGVKPVYGLTA